MSFVAQCAVYVSLFTPCVRTGDAVVRNLLRGGFSVCSMYDTDRSRLTELSDRVPTADCARQVAQQADVIITCQ